MSRNDRVAKAVELYHKFHGHEPKHIDVLDLTDHDVGLDVGTCLGIMYETIRDGKKEKFIHQFAKNSRPVLVCSFDGTQLYLLAGAYTFTPDGIEDI